MSRVGVVIPAGGGGSRMGGQQKAWLELRGKPLLQYCLEVFHAVPDVEQIVVALPADSLHDPPQWLRAPHIAVVAGGAERMDSVRAGLAALQASVDTVVIHDAARPLVRVELVQRVIAAARGQGAIAALPATDTIHLVDAQQRIVQTPERARLWQAQTPQAFPRTLIEDAHRRAQRDNVLGTDDAALVIRYGGVVEVVPGHAENIKITRPRDLVLAEALLAAGP